VQPLRIAVLSSFSAVANTLLTYTIPNISGLLKVRELRQGRRVEQELIEWAVCAVFTTAEARHEISFISIMHQSSHRQTNFRIADISSCDHLTSTVSLPSSSH